MSIKQPSDLSPAEVNDLVENGRLPMSEYGKALRDYGVALLNAELAFSRPVIDLQRRAYDIDVEHLPHAPANERYRAIDLNTFDGSPTGLGSCHGYGPTAQAARFALLEAMAEYPA